jgi:excisionase family DNA binding protein
MTATNTVDYGLFPSYANCGGPAAEAGGQGWSPADSPQPRRADKETLMLDFDASPVGLGRPAAQSSLTSDEELHLARPPLDPSVPYLTAPEAARYLNVRPRYIRRLVEERRITVTRVGRLLRFTRADLDAVTTRCAGTTTAPLTPTTSPFDPADPIRRAVTQSRLSDPPSRKSRRDEWKATT